MATRRRGLGDTIDKVTTKTGIKSVVKFIAGEDCGCDERKEKLNLKFPNYHGIKCLTESEYNDLKVIFEETKLTNSVSPLQQMKMVEIHNRVFDSRLEISSCGSCVRDLLKNLNHVFETYTN